MPRHDDTAADCLARVLRDAYLAAYVRCNECHSAPEWSEVKLLAAGVGWRQLAEELAKRGVGLLPGDPPGSAATVTVETAAETVPALADLRKPEAAAPPSIARNTLLADIPGVPASIVEASKWPAGVITLGDLLFRAAEMLARVGVGLGEVDVVPPKPAPSPAKPRKTKKRLADASSAGLFDGATEGETGQ